MIYVDTSVALAHLLAEDRQSPDGARRESLTDNRLLEYEIWTRIHARRLARPHGDEVRTLLARVALVEPASPVLARALEPFPKPVRTIDALHLASMESLRGRGQAVELASYGERLVAAARDLSIPVRDL